jgi:hypothetical protein
MVPSTSPIMSELNGSTKARWRSDGRNTVLRRQRDGTDRRQQDKQTFSNAIAVHETPPKCEYTPIRRRKCTKLEGN